MFPERSDPLTDSDHTVIHVTTDNLSSKLSRASIVVVGLVVNAVDTLLAKSAKERMFVHLRQRSKEAAEVTLR